ncbi:alpha/beta fold hydrolase [Winogradskyella luteola]|uniref:Alpha/beta hydrolase n=1 Tax=Winogradskyella luteola TaxID=2828330 RepID=A0A9X1FAU4_9FLAO|nr:alpha/beta hydrolase [Winogradskyella luteola]MBV7270314.1 alpha/beta hydrolase [Winogradskyella luteola]
MTSLISLDNSQIEYRFSDKNHCETLLFLHGLGANLSQFDEQYIFFKDIYNVLLVNLRGHGNSKVAEPSNACDYQLSKIAEDVTALVNILGIKKVHLVGNSMGGNIGFEILNSHGYLLSSLTTFGTTVKLKASCWHILTLRLLYKLIPKACIAEISSCTGRTHLSRQKIKKMMLCAQKLTLQLVLPNISEFDYCSVIRNSKIPILVIKAEKDKSINKAINSTVEEIENKKNVQLICMKDVGHFANLDKPHHFNNMLRAFIASKSRISK